MPLGKDVLGPQKPPQKPTQMESSAMVAEGKGLKGFLAQPAVLAFLMQAAATTLAGGGIGRGIGEGFGAAGRVGANRAKKEQTDAAEARRQYEWQQEFDQRERQINKTGRGGGGGGGGGGRGASGKPGPTQDPKALAKMLYDSDLAAWKMKDKAFKDGQGEDPGPMPDILDYNLRAQTIVNAQANGMDIGTYSELRNVGRSDQADWLANQWVSDPAGAKRMMDEFNKPIQTEPSTTTPALGAQPAPDSQASGIQLPGGIGSPSIVPQSTQNMMGGATSPFVQTPFEVPGVLPNPTGDVVPPFMGQSANPWDNFTGIPTPRKRY